MPNDQDDIVNFETLDLEGADTPTLPQKLTDTMKFLKEKLSAEDYAEVTSKLGVKNELSNEDLLEAIKTLLAKKKEEDEDEDEEEMASYKDFMSKCMKEGKSLKECADEWKKKYPEAEEPSKEEQSSLADLEQQLAKKKKKDEDEDEDEYPGPEGKKMKALEDMVKNLSTKVETLTKSLAQEKNTAELAVEVNKLVEERHLAPSQKDAIIKLAAGMGAEDQGELLDFFRTTQKLSGVFDESGRLHSSAPGAGEEITPEAREQRIKDFKIDEIIEDRGVRKRVNN